MKQNENEKNILLNSFLNNQFFKDNIIEHLELVIRPECDQNCEYCYLYKFGKELYPPERRKNKEDLLNNIQIFLDYLIKERKIVARSYELFGGDLFSDNLFFEILDIFYKQYLYLMENNPNIFYKIPETTILVPNNLSFLKNEKLEQKFDEYFNLLKSVNIYLTISYSTDGLYATNTREKKDLDQSWFDKTLSFCAKYGYGTHPMISFENIDNAIENYDWWIKNLNKYHSPETPLWHPMFMEVRNEGWTNKTIDQYIEFLNYVFEYRLALFDNDVYKLALHLRQPENLTKGVLCTPPNDPIRLYVADGYTQNAINCSLGSDLTVNMATLEIIPCHRLAYPHLVAGEFKTNNNKIVDIEAKNNLSNYINMITANRFYRPSCSICEINKFCMRGCLGSQYENYGDPFITIPSICKFNRIKINFLIDKYLELGLFDIILNPEFKYYSEIFTKEIEKILEFKKNFNKGNN